MYILINISINNFRLEDLVNGLVEEFVASGLMRREYDNVKLHLTVMNTLMRKDPSGLVEPGGQRRRPPPRDRESFDATNVLRVSRMRLVRNRAPKSHEILTSTIPVLKTLKSS